MHATGCRCLDHWHTTDGLTQRKIAALDLNLAQEHIERVENFCLKHSSAASGPIP